MYVGILKKMLEQTENYDLILNRSELALVAGLIEILEVFNVFTKFMQGQDYATINMLAIFRTEIDDKLKNVKIFSVDALILRAVDILMAGLEKRFPINNDMIGSALIDPRMHSLPIVIEWLKNGMSNSFKYTESWLMHISSVKYSYKVLRISSINV